jgi:hypothetical protein
MTNVIPINAIIQITNTEHHLYRCFLCVTTQSEDTGNVVAYIDYPVLDKNEDKYYIKRHEHFIQYEDFNQVGLI